MSFNLATYTVVHVVISLAGIASGIVALLVCSRESGRTGGLPCFWFQRS